MNLRLKNLTVKLTGLVSLALFSIGAAGCQSNFTTAPSIGGNLLSKLPRFQLVRVDDDASQSGLQFDGKNRANDRQSSPLKRSRHAKHNERQQMDQSVRKTSYDRSLEEFDKEMDRVFLQKQPSPEDNRPAGNSQQPKRFYPSEQTETSSQPGRSGSYMRQDGGVAPGFQQNPQPHLQRSGLQQNSYSRRVDHGNAGGPISGNRTIHSISDGPAYDSQVVGYGDANGIQQGEIVNDFGPRNPGNYLLSDGPGIRGQHLRLPQAPTANEVALHLKAKVEELEGLLGIERQKNAGLAHELQLTINTLIQANQGLGVSQQQLASARKEITSLRQQIKQLNLSIQESDEETAAILSRLRQAISESQMSRENMQILPADGTGNSPRVQNDSNPKMTPARN